jgi:RNA polymerase sigma-70 factor (ECF subfamily)
MLGSLDEADDAVQEAWLRLSRIEAENVENLEGWLTVVAARVCLDMLRTRQARREEAWDADMPAQFSMGDAHGEPEPEAVMADSVGLALLVVLDRLSPGERVAFVLHDLFNMPFEAIAPILGRSTPAARQLASRARRRVHGADAGHSPDLARQREVVSAFLAASGQGDFEALLNVLDPEVVVRADPAAVPSGAALEMHGARSVAKAALIGGQRAPVSRLALVNGAVGLVVAPRGRLLLVMRFTLRHDKIVELDVVAEAERLRKLALSVIAD